MRHFGACIIGRLPIRPGHIVRIHPSCRTIADTVIGTVTVSETVETAAVVVRVGPGGHEGTGGGHSEG